MKDELKLVFPTEEYKEQMEEYLKEHFDNGEYELNGDGGLDRIKDFDEWLQKIKNDVSKQTIQVGKIPSTVFLGVRKSDNRVVGTIQIRHELNERLLKNIGHIGDGVRPSERRKGYATEMIKLALEECKKLGIQRVLMACYKDNIGSSKSIQKNGGILENEFLADNGKIEQRYWISLKKRYANSSSQSNDVIETQQKMKSIEENDFKGDMYLENYIKVRKPYMLKNGLCIRNNGYKWLQFYDYTSKVALTAIYDENNEIVEWYFDIAREIGKENEIPYEDDMYLDVVLQKDGKIILLDEDELKAAYERLEISKQEFDETYQIANNLMEKLKSKEEKVKAFTDKYLKLIIGDG